MSFRRVLGLVMLLLAAAAAPALALGPVDIELEGGYWDNDLDVEDASGTESEGAAAPYLRGIFTVGRFGLRLAHYESDTDRLGDAEYQSADVMFRLFKLTENNRLSVGAGVQRLAYDTGSGDDSTTGARVAAEGRVGLFKLVFLYGEAAYYPDLGDITVGGVTVDDLSGFDVEAGVAIHPLPFLWINAGYRDVDIDGNVPGSDVSLGASGYLAGVLFKF